MATNIYETVVNSITGESFRCTSFNEQALVMDWIVQPKGYVAFEHIHLHQDEVFSVREGELRLVIDGKEHIAQKGETITVPMGAKHIAYNNKESVLDCSVSYKPGLDHDKFMQCFMGLIKDNELDQKGSISIPKMGYCLSRMKAKCLSRPTEIPAFAFGIGLKAFRLRGTLSGWGKQYEKYTGS